MEASAPVESIVVAGGNGAAGGGGGVSGGDDSGAREPVGGGDSVKPAAVDSRPAFDGLSVLQEGAAATAAAAAAAAAAAVGPGCAALEIREGYGRTALYLACVVGNLQIVELLVAHGANVSCGF